MPASDPRQAAATPRWRVRGRTIDLDRPVVLGIVNVTPDRFRDGGNFFSREAAEAHAGQLLQEGADVLDVGGESTRPQGATPVDAEEEMRRILPVVAAIRKRFPDAIISVDTVKSVVAAEALAEGAQIINDVSGLRLDGKMGPVCAAAGAGVILMHSRGGVSTMGTYLHATYGADVTGEVAGELADRAREAVIAGVARESIVVDPGIGFSKRSEHSLALLAELPRIAAWAIRCWWGCRASGSLARSRERRRRRSACSGRWGRT
jgi:dihydropteroate synthase